MALSLCLFGISILPAVAGTGGPALARVESFRVASVADLVRTLDRGWNSVTAADGETAPALAPSALPAGLGDLPVPLKKTTFLRSVLPLVVSVNAEVARDRTRLQKLAARHAASDGRLATGDHAWVVKLAKAYRLPRAEEGLASGEALPVLNELLLRVDGVPVSLALAQAALESGWGTSRFALEGNSLFGQWVFSSRGMDPAGRPDGARYSVARFRSLRGSVAAYVRNLNTSWAYEEYRALRAEQRAAGDGALDSHALAGGLLRYSTRREAYVKEVRAVIRGNRLVKFDGVRILLAEGVIAGDPMEPEELAMDERAGVLPPDA